MAEGVSIQQRGPPLDLLHNAPTTPAVQEDEQHEQGCLLATPHPPVEFVAKRSSGCASPCQGGGWIHISDPGALPQTLILLLGERCSLQERLQQRTEQRTCVCSYPFAKHPKCHARVPHRVTHCVLVPLYRRMVGRGADLRTPASGSIGATPSNTRGWHRWMPPT